MSSPDDAGRHPIDELAEAFLERYRRGERPDPSEFARLRPDLADEIRELFPALVQLEQLGRRGGLEPGWATGPTPAPAPQRLGEYRIIREVGHGGMGVVYEAVQEPLGRLVALKVLPPLAVADPTRRERFRREARAAARLHHTNIVPVFGVGEADGVQYYAMQFIAGQGLDQVLREVRRLRHLDAPETGDSADHGDRGRFSASIAQGLFTGQFCPPGEPATSPDPAPVRIEPVSASATSDWSGRSDRYARNVARIGLQVAEALAHAHEQGVLHRDVKPSNVVIDVHGNAWVTDFGLAKLDAEGDLTRTGDFLGTLRYMAPERLQGISDPLGDVYGLGLTLYEALALRPAFDAADRSRLIERIARGEPMPLRKLDGRISRDLETIVLKAVAREPCRRYRTSGELADDLRRFLENKPIRARRTSAPEHAWRWCRRNPLAAASAAIALSSLLAGLCASAWQWRRAERQRARAEANFAKTRAAVDECFQIVTRHPAYQEPGMQAAREVLLRTSLKYYRDFMDQKGDDPEIRAEVARAHWRVGVITEQIGSASEALAAFERARQLLEDLVRARPADPGYREALADCGLSLFNVHRRLDHPDGAEEALRRALDLREALARELPADVDRRGRLAEALVALGRFRRGAGRREETALALREAIDLREGIARERPDRDDNLAGLAEAYRILGETYSEVTRPADAIAAWRKAMEIQGRLVRGDPDRPQYLDTLAALHSDLGTSLFHNGGGAEEIEAEYLKAVPLRERLAREHPRVLGYQESLGRLLNNLGLFHSIRRRFEEAAADYARALAVREGLARTHPDVGDYRRALAKTHHDLGLMYSKAGDTARAGESYRKALAIQDELMRVSPANEDYQTDCACTLKNLGSIDARRGEVPAAIERFERAMRILEPVVRAEPRHQIARRFLEQTLVARAQALTAFGRPGEALQDWNRVVAMREPPVPTPWRLGRAAALARGGEHARAAAEADAIASEAAAGEDLVEAARVHALACAAVSRDAGSLPAGDRRTLVDRYGRRGVDLLVRAARAGALGEASGAQDLLRDADFAPFLDRPDFRELLSARARAARVR